MRPDGHRGAFFDGKFLTVWNNTRMINLGLRNIVLCGGYYIMGGIPSILVVLGAGVLWDLLNLSIQKGRVVKKRRL